MVFAYKIPLPSAIDACLFLSSSCKMLFKLYLIYLFNGFEVLRIRSHDDNKRQLHCMYFMSPYKRNNYCIRILMAMWLRVNHCHMHAQSTDVDAPTLCNLRLHNPGSIRWGSIQSLLLFLNFIHSLLSIYSHIYWPRSHTLDYKISK